MLEDEGQSGDIGRFAMKCQNHYSALEDCSSSQAQILTVPGPDGTIARRKVTGESNLFDYCISGEPVGVTSSTKRPRETETPKALSFDTGRFWCHSSNRPVDMGIFQYVSAACRPEDKGGATGRHIQYLCDELKLPLQPARLLGGVCGMLSL